MTIDAIDFSRLKPYEGKTTRSFELLVFMLAHKEFGHLGTFSPIDGSGGDSGVEFFLQIPSGEKWGWQCKFYSDGGRIHQKGRAKSIQDSLTTACRNHPTLTRMYLCTASDFTSESISPKGKFSKGEHTWFQNELPQKIPSGRSVQLLHWGQTKLLDLLKDPKHEGIRNFFFGQLELTQQWLEQKFTQNFSAVRDKYNPELHTLDAFTESLVDCALLEKSYITRLKTLHRELEGQIQEIFQTLKENTTGRYEAEDPMRSFREEVKEFQDHTDLLLQVIDDVTNCFRSFTSTEHLQPILEQRAGAFVKKIKALDLSAFEEGSSTRKAANGIIRQLYVIVEDFQRFFRNYFHLPVKALHFLGGPGKGKTHLSCDLAYKRIKAGRAALFIPAIRLSDQTSIEKALLELLDIPSAYSFSDLLAALDVLGELQQEKIPIVLDGLNETTLHNLFSPIWHHHLEALEEKVAQYRHLVLITTCRKTYKERVWKLQKRFHFLDGFEYYETRVEVVRKYFSFYHLTTDLTFSNLHHFADPVFLKMYCELKNPNARQKTIQEVSIEEVVSFDIFGQYLQAINEQLTTSHPILRPREPFVSRSLARIARYLWENSCRELPIEEFYLLIDGPIPYEKDKSKADLLIHEGLIFTRDMRSSGETAGFTYQLMAGYLIAQYLLENSAPGDLLFHPIFIQALSEGKQRHPLYDDILYALCYLLPAQKGCYLHDLIPYKGKAYKASKLNRVLFHQSITSLFTQPAALVHPSDLQLVSRLFKEKANLEQLFPLFDSNLSSSRHPLNACFLAQALEGMSMSLRDRSWTEYVRKEAYSFTPYLEHFIQTCRYLPLQDSPAERLHTIARLLPWFLTSTVRKLRDLATKALYFYGRKFPEKLLELTERSLKANDPYVWEQTLAALYGVTLSAVQNPQDAAFKTALLLRIGQSLFAHLFAPGATHATTHILARDYACKTIVLALKQHPTMLSSEEQQRIHPPYNKVHHRPWVSYPYQKERLTDDPMHMDFTNYTIGSIVKDGHSYSNPPEKQQVRSQLYWRIFDLGWSARHFSVIDKQIANSSGYPSRSYRPLVERYGKKYSWIAFYEMAGYRDDLGLLEERTGGFRNFSDLDPCFPERDTSFKLIHDDLLGDRSTTIQQWYYEGGFPEVEMYLKTANLLDQEGEWVCIDGYLSQEDKESWRERWVFSRSFLVPQTSYEEVLSLLQKQHLGGRWLPEKREIYGAFADEVYVFENAAPKNTVDFNFVLKTEKRRIKKGEPGYYPTFELVEQPGSFAIKEVTPEEIERDVTTTQTFEVLQPVADFNQTDHYNDPAHEQGGNDTIVAPELARALHLHKRPQSFDLYDNTEKKAVQIFSHHDSYNNTQNFVFIRKDLLDRFLNEQGYRLVWALWGERDVHFPMNSSRFSTSEESMRNTPQVFQKIISYKT